MERYKKSDMLQTVDTLLRANNTVNKIAASSPQGVSEALVQCQESAIMLGNAIEAYGEDYTPLVQILEDYCENLYQMNEKLLDENFRRKTAKKIQKQLISLQNSIKYDLPDDKKEVVFLPYKASMWDSLESVWRAADADPDCNAYVIPIPYYDKNPDGGFKEEHYEGDQYPKDVPITRYEEYDLEAEHPDVIYIHNPYDECNHVTSVHPYFYAKNIRKFTDKLVYIPYFILPEIEPDEQAAIDGMKHFCFTPGTIYAHQVIVQSENMRQIYINEYIKAAKEMELGGEHVDRRFQEKKFLGLGSPKLDRVQNTKKEDLEIPAEWLKIIEKPDGSRKKIVFYNTSVSALLHSDEKMLRKMESVFEIFKENQDEVALLWRPHPLIQATIGSMRPQLWLEYQKIKDRYIEEGWGIYDDSADVDRAVVISDAYYGDGSSVVQLCREKGMPVMLQNIDILCKSMLENDGHINISIIDAVMNKDKIWFIAHDFNGIFFMDIKTGKIKLAGMFPDEEFGTMRLYESMKIVDERIYFAPFNAKSIAVFDMKKNIFSNIVLDEEQLGCSLSQPLFGGMERYGRNIYMMPIYSKAIVCLDTDSGKTTYITGWAKDVSCAIFNEKDAYFRRQTVLVGHKIMAPFCNANAVLEFDCETTGYKIHILGSEKGGYSGICFDGGSFWLTPRAVGDLVRWNAKTNVTESVLLCGDKEKDRPYAYVGVIYFNKNLVVFPTFECENRSRTGDISVTVPKGIYRFVRQDGDIFLYYREDLGSLIIKNMETKEKTETKIEIDCADADMKALIKIAGILVNETRHLNIRGLIGMLKAE